MQPKIKLITRDAVKMRILVLLKISFERLLVLLKTVENPGAAMLLKVHKIGN